MNPLHLLWIVPLSITAGVFMLALCVAAGKEIPMDNEVLYEDDKQYSGLLEEDE